LSTTLYGEDIDNLLNDATNYSSKTNLNIDYQPSVLTVLYGQDLEHLGIQTLSEALDFVPGLQTNVGTSSSTKISVRGNAQSFNGVYEKIKFFINGVDINANYYSDFPIVLIQRIEVLRGGVSAIYGQNGFIGAINIITKSATDGQNSLSLGTGSFNKKSASVTLKETFGNWDIGVDSHYLKHDKRVAAPSAKTTVSIISGNQFDRKYESLEGVEDKSVGVTLQNENLSISSMYLEKYSQNNYGFFGLLDFNEEGYTKYTTTTSQIDYQKEFSQNNYVRTILELIE
jgi:iron complex outermembrane receptor protein